MDINNLVNYMNNTINYGTLAYTLFSLGKLAISKARLHYRSKSLVKLLGNRSVVVHIPSRKVDRLKPVVAMEDYNTYEKIRSVLLSNGFTVDVKYISPDGFIELTPNKANVVVCGPKNSPIVKKTFNNLKDTTFILQNETWSLKSGKETLKSPIEDYYNQHAFLGKLRLDIPNYKEPVLLICGVHAIGSDGVAFYLNDNKALDNLLLKVKKGLFHCVITSSYSADSKQVYAAKLREGSLCIKEDR